jgi:hypothetical protein
MVEAYKLTVGEADKVYITVVEAESRSDQLLPVTTLH